MEFGALGYPSPLVNRTDRTFLLELAPPSNVRSPVASATLRLRVTGPLKVTVPLGAFRAYKVSSTIDLEILVGSSRGTTINLEQVHWVVPHIGPVKTQSLQQTFDIRGADLGTFGSDLEATSINF